MRSTRTSKERDAFIAAMAREGVPERIARLVTDTARLGRWVSKREAKRICALWQTQGSLNARVIDDTAKWPLVTLVRCPGEAHKNPNIDHCGLCAPRWGWIEVRS